MMNNTHILKDLTKDSKIQIKLIKSTIGRKKDHIACVKSLGLSTMNSTKDIYATPINLGKIKKIGYMLEVKEVSNEA